MSIQRPPDYHSWKLELAKLLKALRELVEAATKRINEKE